MLIDSLRALFSGYPISLESILMQILATLFVIFCILPLHEYAHGWMAERLGDHTARYAGRLTLNPLASLDPIGALFLLLFGFGWAKPVPVDMRYFKNPKWGMALCALAGPVSNFLLAALCMPLAYGALYAALGGAMTGAWVWLFDFLIQTALLSIGLGVFNLIPIPPLDGSKVLFAFLPDRLYEKLMRYERYGMLALLVLIAVGALNGVVNTMYAAVLRLFGAIFGLW